MWQEISKEADHMSGRELEKYESCVTGIHCDEVHYTQLGGCRAQRRALILLQP